VTAEDDDGDRGDLAQALPSLWVLVRVPADATARHSSP
jgi:hypothetical protein